MLAMPAPVRRLPVPDPVEVDALAARLRAHVAELAGRIGVRHKDVAGSLEAAADYVDAQLAGAGYDVRREQFGVVAAFENVEAEIPGAQRAGEIVIVGAHYDTVPGSPGADDNASGVAAVIELARMFAGSAPARTLRFVAFANEEKPFLLTDDSGSTVYARRARERGETIVAMLSLEMLGYYNPAPGSQSYPRPLAWFFPDRADFIGFVGNLASRALVQRTIAAYRERAAVPAEGMAVPAALVRDARRSDHASFWARGYPALMVTDTAGFRYPFYHLALDTAESLDYGRMAQVVLGLAHALRAEVQR
ncbi:MAG: M20/M25/M40 family metallo-hydrolase [Gammaproteobacteria bacterium]|nr:M20/M25/M40 family metallo-hydrolase [Gammaproteobacteria bacterium]